MEPYPAPSTFPTSLLDNDLYKFTMQQAVLQHFPSSKVVYRFTNRTKDRKFNRESVEWIADKIGGEWVVSPPVPNPAKDSGRSV